jgi:F-type H+-transporting ATPase subunit b
VTELLTDAHFWIAVAFVVFVGILVMAGIHKFAWKALGAAGERVQAQLDEAAAIRKEAEDLLAQIKIQSAEAEKTAAEMLSAAKAEAKRLEKESAEKLADQIKRRGEMAERKIATAEAQAAADVKAAAADLAAQLAENVLAARISGAKTDPLVDDALKGLAGKLQ